MAPLGRCATVRRSARPRGQTDLTVSVLDLERLFLVSYRALRYLRTCVPAYRQTPDVPAPHSERTQKRLVYCSLNDVNSAVSCDPTAQHIRRCPGQSDRHDSLPGQGMVGRGGVEPPTSRLSGVRSNHLSYRPIPAGRPALAFRWRRAGPRRPARASIRFGRSTGASDRAEGPTTDRWWSLSGSNR
jgi:hypothetical protein